MDRASTSKLRVLFRGWILQHSYAMVFTNQLLTFAKNFNDRMIIYLEEREYFNQKWNSSKKFVFSKEDSEIVSKIQRYNGEDIDIIYNITFPYDIQPIQRKDKSFIPKLVFFTSEYAILDSTYFSINYPERVASNNNIESIITQILNNPRFNIYTTCPSSWSAMGLSRYIDINKRNKVIPHGVSMDFHKHSDIKRRNAMRRFYKFDETDIVLLNIGSMTQNKGIIEILTAFYKLIYDYGKTNFKLLLKGSDSLYNSLEFVKTYIKIIIENATNINKDSKEFEKCFRKMCSSIVYISDTFSNERLNDLFNACDIYVSPYIAEGFNLVPLEALSSGMKLVISKTGSTKDYITDIMNSVENSDTLIHMLDTKITKDSNGYKNTYSINDLIETILTASESKPTIKTISDVHNVIHHNYNWNSICEQVFNYMNEIVRNNN